MKKIIIKKSKADNESIPSPEQYGPVLESDVNMAEAGSSNKPPLPSDGNMTEAPGPSALPVMMFEAQARGPSTTQPPLPPNPPLPEQHQPPLPATEYPLLVPKKEIIDDEYPSTSNVTVVVKTEPANTPEPEMCIDWFRGSCIRKRCKHAHKVYINQLRDLKIYDWCHDYQNKCCFRPRCKKVHATVGEIEKFYKTAILPAHCFTHLHNVRPPPLPTGNGSYSSTSSAGASTTPRPNSSGSSRFNGPSASGVSNRPPSAHSNNIGVTIPNNMGVPPPSGPPRNWPAHEGTQGTCRCGKAAMLDNRILHTEKTLENLNKSIAKSAREIATWEDKKKRLNAVITLFTHQ